MRGEAAGGAEHLRIFGERVERNQPAHARPHDRRVRRPARGGVARVDIGFEFGDDELEIGVGERCALIELLDALPLVVGKRSEEHTSELQSLMRISYAVFCLKKKKTQTTQHQKTTNQRPTDKNIL